MGRIERRSGSIAPLIRAQARDSRVLPEWRNRPMNPFRYVSPLHALVSGSGLFLALCLMAVWVRHERSFAVTFLAIGPATCTIGSYAGGCKTTLVLDGIRENSSSSGSSSRYYLEWNGEVLAVRSISAAFDTRSDGLRDIVVEVQHAAHLRLPSMASPGTLRESRPLFAWVAASTFIQTDSTR
jgi:hypothetical protein